ncbi:MAG: arylesterase [Gammaproteobacteria bacterium 28-57-27]|nr:MAG: arylesterase [Gammaproteobacteria bacterium 28-57-27]
MLFRFVVLILSLTANPSFGQALSPTAPNPQTILVLGDSLSAAHNIAQNKGWVTLMAQRLAQTTPPWKVINVSISGETTSGGLSRLPALLAAQRPQWVLIELGANDGLRGLPLKIMHQNLQRMIELSQHSGAKVLLIGIMLPPNYGAMYTTPFTAMFQQLAEEYRLPLVPFLLDGVASEPSLMQYDGLHPNAAAQGKIFDNVWRVAEPLWR